MKDDFNVIQHNSSKNMPQSILIDPNVKSQANHLSILVPKTLVRIPEYSDSLGLGTLTELREE